MTKLAPALHTATLWLGVVGSLVTILAFAFPESRDWIDDNGLLGLAAVLVVLISASIIDGFHTVRCEALETELKKVTANLNDERARVSSLESAAVQREALEAELRKITANLETECARVFSLESELEQMRAATDRRSKNKDLELLDDLLGEIQPGSKFYEYLADYVDFKHLPTWFDSTLKARYDRWVSEPRPVADTPLAAAWSRMVQQARDYIDPLKSYLWPAGSGSDSAGDPDWLSLPMEWHYTQKDAARKELQDAHDKYVDALDALFALMHEYR